MIDTFANHLELFELDNKQIPIAIISVPFNSTNSSELMKTIVKSLDKLYKGLQSVVKLVEQANKTLEKTSILNKIKEQLVDFLYHVPNEGEEIFQYTKLLSEAVPYVTTALRITNLFLEHKQKERFESFEKEKMLLVVDDLEDLRPNWNILSDMLNYRFHYLFVIRVEEPDKYLSLLNDRTFSARYLENLGIAKTVKERVILPPPSFEIFRIK
jgi:hypothetical protein